MAILLINDFKKTLELLKKAKLVTSLCDFKRLRVILMMFYL